MPVTDTDTLTDYATVIVAGPVTRTVTVHALPLPTLVPVELTRTVAVTDNVTVIAAAPVTRTVTVTVIQFPLRMPVEPYRCRYR